CYPPSFDGVRAKAESLRCVRYASSGARLYTGPGVAAARQKHSRADCAPRFGPAGAVGQGSEEVVIALCTERTAPGLPGTARLRFSFGICCRWHEAHQRGRDKFFSVKPRTTAS